MLHKKDDIPYTVEELKNIIKNLKNEKTIKVVELFQAVEDLVKVLAQRITN